MARPTSIRSLEYYGLLREAGRAIPALMVVSPRTLDQLGAAPAGASRTNTSRVRTRPSPCAGGSRRCASAARPSTTGPGPILQSGPLEADGWTARATVIAVFNPKGGVGKTTIATNLASALQIRKRQNVLLLDADTVTGHVTTSLGMNEVRTVVDSWRDEADGGPIETLSDLAAAHSSGLRVASLTSSPLHSEILDPERVSTLLSAARRGFDYVIVDLHPSYSALNQAIFETADRILVPVTPDVPAIRAAVQLSDLAAELGIRDRLALVINRANSGVSVADMERTVGMPSLALLRSGGLLFVRAANEGRTVIEMFPREKISEDFDALADRVLGTPAAVAGPETRVRVVQSTEGRRPARSASRLPYRPDGSWPRPRPVSFVRAPTQRERSCQLVPPSGAPGSGCGRTPVRRSICSRPRR